MQAENADSAGLNRFPIWPATFARSAAHAGNGERTHVYLSIYIYIYISIVTARPLSPQEGARSRSPQLGECNALWGERERSRRQPYLLSTATQTRRRGVQ